MRALMDDGTAEGEQLGVVWVNDGGWFDLNLLAEGIARFAAEYGRAAESSGRGA